MVRSDVVTYLRDNIKKFPVEDLRLQLEREGVTDQEFEASLKEAMKARPGAPKAAKSPVLAKVVMFAGFGAIIVAAALAVLQKPQAASESASTALATTGSEGGFVGHYGYVVRLPQGYSAVQSFKDSKKTVEIVHFAKTGADPTSFLDEGLYGQLGIVRLQVQPSPVTDDLHALESLTSMVTGRAQQRAEKFTTKNLQLSSLLGVQLTYEAPYPRVEAYILGRNVLYSFTAGQDDDAYRELMESLRDARSEI